MGSEVQYTEYFSKGRKVKNSGSLGQDDHRPKLSNCEKMRIFVYSVKDYNVCTQHIYTLLNHLEREMQPRMSCYNRIQRMF